MIDVDQMSLVRSVHQTAEKFAKRVQGEKIIRSKGDLFQGENVQETEGTQWRMIQMIIAIEIDQANGMKIRRKVIAQMMNVIGGEIQHFQWPTGQFRDVFDGIVREIQYFDLLKRTKKVVVDQMYRIVLKTKFEQMVQTIENMRANGGDVIVTQVKYF